MLCKIWLTPLLEEDQEKELHRAGDHSGNYRQLRGGNMSLHPPAPAPAQHQRHNNCKVWYLVWLHCGKLSRFMTDAPHCCTLGRVQHHTMANKLLYNPNLVQKETRFAISRHFSTMSNVWSTSPKSWLFSHHPLALSAIMSANVRFTAEMRGQLCDVVGTGASGPYLPACGHCWNFVVDKIWYFVRGLAFFFWPIQIKTCCSLVILSVPFWSHFQKACVQSANVWRCAMLCTWRGSCSRHISAQARHPAQSSLSICYSPLSPDNLS